MRRIAIIGGGISGLTAAYVLHRDHATCCSFVLFEASSRLGGIVETVRANGFTIECGPDSWVTEKPWAAELAREIGLGDALLPSLDAERRTYLARKGDLTPLPEGMRMMVPTDMDAVERSPLFTDEAKQAYRDEPRRSVELRAAALLHRGAEADEPVAAFVRRHFGEEVARTVAGPLLAGIFGGDVEQLSARALLGLFLTMEASHGSLIAALAGRTASGASVFTTLSGGLDSLVERLQSRLPERSVVLGCGVRAVEASATGWYVTTAVAKERFDAILLATPLDTTRRLLAGLSPDARRAANLLPEQAASGLVVALGYAPEQAPALPPGFGLLAAEPQEDSLLACTFLHQKFPGRAPAGGALLRAFFTSSAADALAQRSDADIAREAEHQLAALLGPLPARPDVLVVRRWPRSLPQYHVGHTARITAFEEALARFPSLHVAGNALRGVGLSDLIRDAATVAHALAEG